MCCSSKITFTNNYKSISIVGEWPLYFCILKITGEIFWNGIFTEEKLENTSRLVKTRTADYDAVSLLPPHPPSEQSGILRY